MSAPSFLPGRHPLPVLLAGLVLLGLGCMDPDDGLWLVGTVERTAIELAAPASETVVEVAVQRGQRVEPGQLVVRLDDTLARVEVARAEAALASARTSDRVAQDDLARARKLRSGRVVSEQELDQARLKRDEAAARLREALAVLEASRKRVADLSLSSPVAGTVDQLPFDPGERVPAGAVVAVLLDAGEPWVRVWVPQDRASLLVPGTAAAVEVDGVAGPLRGRVLDVAREPSFTPHYALTERDRVHLVYETRIAITNAPRSLRPGLPAEVYLARPDPGAIAAPGFGSRDTP